MSTSTLCQRPDSHRFSGRLLMDMRTLSTSSCLLGQNHTLSMPMEEPRSQWRDKMGTKTSSGSSTHNRYNTEKPSWLDGSFGGGNYHSALAWPCWVSSLALFVPSFMLPYGVLVQPLTWIMPWERYGHPVSFSSGVHLSLEHNAKVVGQLFQASQTRDVW